MFEPKKMIPVLTGAGLALNGCGITHRSFEATAVAYCDKVADCEVTSKEFCLEGIGSTKIRDKCDETYAILLECYLDPAVNCGEIADGYDGISVPDDCTEEADANEAACG